MSLRYGPTFYRHARNQLRLSEIKLCKFPAGPKLIQNGTSALNAALDRSEGEGKPAHSGGKLVLTCPTAECRHQADYSSASVSRFQKQPGTR
jgi:hypothetical protein